MMHCKVIYCLLITKVLLLDASGVSSKLDFDEDEKRIIRSDDIKLENYRNDDNSATTVVCVNGGCNKTEAKADEIFTDVVVHVKTSQNVAKTNKTIEEIPDVPIVVGYGGTTQKPILSDSLLNSNPITVTNFEENAFYPSNFNPIASRTHSHPSFQRKFSPDYKQQFIWYPKGSVSYNPVEFKRFEKPVAWNQPWNRVQYTRPEQFSHQQHVTTPGYTTCTCQNPGLRWYPTTPTWNIPNQRSDGIDDKLGELN